jgi:hypothetical protein
MYVIISPSGGVCDVLALAFSPAAWGGLGGDLLGIDLVCPLPLHAGQLARTGTGSDQSVPTYQYSRLLLQFWYLRTERGTDSVHVLVHVSRSSFINVLLSLKSKLR